MSPVIRVATLDDAQRIAEIYAPAVVERVTSFELVAPGAEEMASRLTRVLSRYPWLVSELDGRVIGYAYASAHHERAAYRWSADVAVYVGPEVHRRGVGTALYAALFEILAPRSAATCTPASLCRTRRAKACIAAPGSVSWGLIITSATNSGRGMTWRGSSARFFRR